MVKTCTTLGADPMDESLKAQLQCTLDELGSRQAEGR
jgi:hypothetical protein